MGKHPQYDDRASKQSFPTRGMTSLLRIVNKSNKELYYRYPFANWSPKQKSKTKFVLTHIEDDLRAQIQKIQVGEPVDYKRHKKSFLGLLTAFEVCEETLDIRIQSWESYGIVYSIDSECTLCRTAW